MKYFEEGFRRYEELASQIEVSQTLYKYRNFEDKWGKNWLFKPSIYYASPSSFNDPFDCANAESFMDFSTEEIERWLEIQVNRFKHYPDYRPEMVEEKRREFDDREAFQRNWMKFHSDLQNDAMGVVSLSMSWDISTQWGYYANSHSGFCIGYDLDMVRSVFKGRGGPVVYDIKFPVLHPLDLDSSNKNPSDWYKSAFCQTHFKHPNWSHEREFRVVKMVSVREGFVNRELEIPFGTIKEVVLGHYIKGENKTEVIDHCIKHGIPVYQVISKPWESLELLRERIE